MPDLPTLSDDLIQQLRGIFYAKDRSVILDRTNWLGIPLIDTPDVNPNGGNYFVYLKEDGNLYGLDSGGNEYQFTRGNDISQVSKLYDSDFDVVALTADSDGYISAPYQPIFSAEKTVASNNVTGTNDWFTMVFDTVITNIGSHYDNTTGTFTAPKDGQYILRFDAYLSDISTVNNTNGYWFIITSNRTYGIVVPVNFSTYYINEICVICDMDEDDTAYCQIRVDGTSKQVDVAAGSNFYNRFMGYLLPS